MESNSVCNHTSDNKIGRPSSGSPICLSRVLYESANDPRTANDPGPQTIPKLDRKWSRTASDPHVRPQMIPTKKYGMAWIDIKMTQKNIFLFYKKYSIVVVIFLFLWRICDIAWRSVLFISGPFAYYSNWFCKDTCYVEHPGTSENMLNRILFLLYMINASAVHVWFQWKSGREYKTHIPMKKMTMFSEGRIWSVCCVVKENLLTILDAKKINFRPAT